MSKKKSQKVLTQEEWRKRLDILSESFMDEAYAAMIEYGNDRGWTR